MTDWPPGNHRWARETGSRDKTQRYHIKEACLQACRPEAADFIFQGSGLIFMLEGVCVGVCFGVREGARC